MRQRAISETGCVRDFSRHANTIGGEGIHVQDKSRRSSQSKRAVIFGVNFSEPVKETSKQKNKNHCRVLVEKAGKNPVNGWKVEGKVEGSDPKSDRLVRGDGERRPDREP